MGSKYNIPLKLQNYIVIATAWHNSPQERIDTYLVKISKDLYKSLKNPQDATGNIGLIYNFMYDCCYDVKDFLEKVRKERIRQNIKHPDSDHDYDRWYLLILEELGEVIKEFYDGNEKRMEKEVIQFSALIVRYLECNFESYYNDETVTSKPYII